MYSVKSKVFSGILMWLSLVVVVVAGGGGGACLAGSLSDTPTPPRLFIGVDAAGVAEDSAAGGVTRNGGPQEMKVRVDLSLIAPGAAYGGALAATLPDGVEVSLRRKRIEVRGRNDYTWSGKVEGHATSTVVLTVVHGYLRGHIDFDGEAYSVEPEGNGYTLVKGDLSKVPPFADDAVEPGRLPAGMLAKERASSAQAEDGSVIDVLILYTRQMQNKYGSRLDAVIQNLVDLGNTAYQNSKIKTKLRIAGKQLFTAEGAGEGKSTEEALTFLLSNEQVAAWREAAVADLTCLLRVHPGNASPCGQAYMMTAGYEEFFDQLAFSVVQVRSAAEADPYYCDDRSLTHEIGHNEGCDHDRDHSAGGGVYPYSYGYDVAGVFATIMSYDRPTVTFFSNPTILYQGRPMGKDVHQPDSAHNALSINNTRTIVANFRVRKYADFSASPTKGLAPLTVWFTDRSVEGVTSRQWDFGDGFSSTLRNPRHTYKEPGAYTVILTVAGPDISGSEAKPSFITVSPVPSHAGFSASPTSGAAPLMVKFTDKSRGKITSRLWKFGDGRTSTLVNPAHRYGKPGKYTVRLLVDGPGGPDEMIKKAYINVTPE